MNMRKISSVKFLPRNPRNTLNGEFSERKWLEKHGKLQYLSLSDDLMKKLRQYFDALDSNGFEYISAEDLQEPLILFGLCQNKQEVEKLVKMIDTNNSGVIQFDQFVQIFKIAKNNKKVTKGREKFQKFAQIITGNVHEQLENRICIRNSLSEYKRKKVIDFLKRKDRSTVEEGKRIAQLIALKSQRYDLLPSLKNFC